ncbi:conjugal transfer protein TraD [Phenylobacterium sp. LH3H17]|uniref:conjugal transfer protein TraD n=1 Tax=Phenylobacterium sp. LH3H17 TaxID=2903901 RepID=UPI0020C9AB2B|nr:conjugal transfer protein TraD [Phenylobacterium sp. LH3H17]UTP40931.1 conjugal transfer protein TraD [Phenylobacterium sp. LH3H17]
MRRPRDLDAELRGLAEKAKGLKDRKTRQLGELVEATGADQVPVEVLAGALLEAARSDNAQAKAAWRARGEAFFRQGGKGVAQGS